jgi:hypothetical protein
MTKVSIMHPDSKDIKLEMFYSKRKPTPLLSQTSETNNTKSSGFDI